MASELTKDSNIKDLLDEISKGNSKIEERLGSLLSKFEDQFCFNISDLIFPPNDTEAGLRASLLAEFKIPIVIANRIVFKMKEMGLLNENER